MQAMFLNHLASRACVFGNCQAIFTRPNRTFRRIFSSAKGYLKGTAYLQACPYCCLAGGMSEGECKVRDMKNQDRQNRWSYFYKPTYILFQNLQPVVLSAPIVCIQRVLTHSKEYSYGRITVYEINPCLLHQKYFGRYKHAKQF